MYTWGYMKENALGKLNLSEAEANEQGFLSRFSYYANEAMTQICSAVRPKPDMFEIVVDDDNRDTLITMPDNFVAFDDAPIEYLELNTCVLTCWEEVGDEYVKYCGYNQIRVKHNGKYRIPYLSRWFFFTKETRDADVIPAPADICEAIPSYIAAQCWKIDDETRSAIYRNEFEMFLARLDDTSFKSQRSFNRGGGW